MQNSSVKRAVCDALKDHLSSRPEFVGVNIVAPQQDYEAEVVYPHIVVIPQRMDFNVWQEDEVDESIPGKVLLHIGDFEGSVEIRCGAVTPYAREQLEALVWAAFFEREGAPGMLVLQTDPIAVGGVQYGFQPTVAYAMEDDSWNEEMVFTAPRYTYLTLNTVFPALVGRGAYTIDQMVSAFTTDLSSDTPDEQRQVNADGSTTTL